MRIEIVSEEDFAFGMSPCSPPVVSVATTGHLTLRVEFADGINGLVTFLLSLLSGMFEALKSPDYFANAAVGKIPGLVKDMIGNGAIFPALKAVQK